MEEKDNLAGPLMEISMGIEDLAHRQCTACMTRDKAWAALR